MIPANHTKFGIWWWNTFSRVSTKIFFKEFLHEPSVEIDPNRALLIIGNHISMWDPWWTIEVNQRYYKKLFHVMMLEGELQGRPLLSKGGAFSINRKSRTMVDTLNYAAKVLEDPKNMVLLYPQGRIHSIYDRPMKFEPGIEKLIKKVKADIQIVFYSVLVDYLADFRPTAIMRFGEFSATKHPKHQELEDAYNVFYQKCLEQQSLRAKKDDVGFEGDA